MTDKESCSHTHSLQLRPCKSLLRGELLEGWLAGVLQEKLGNYLELGKELLRMGLWKGDLVLRDIQLCPVGTDRPLARHSRGWRGR